MQQPGLPGKSSRERDEVPALESSPASVWSVPAFVGVLGRRLRSGSLKLALA